MAKSQEAHKTGGGIGGKAKREISEAKRARRVANLAQRADENRGRASGGNSASKAKK
jgi:hypothetical protein